MTLRTVTFDYKLAIAGTDQGANAHRLDPNVPMFCSTARDRLILSNGINELSRSSFISSNAGVTDYSNPIYQLVYPAPPDDLPPLISGPGMGRIYGRGLKWRYRWKNSITGDVGGLSPASDVSYDLGVDNVTGGNRYFGQNAYFNIAVTGQKYPFNYVDTVQLFRNTTSEQSIWYLVKEVRFTSSDTYVAITDDRTDEEIVFNETADLAPNPSYEEGAVLPFVKSHLHSTSRTILYGILPMGPYRAGTCTVTEGSRTVLATDTTTFWDRSRIGQRFRVKTGNDGTFYRIVNIGATVRTGDTLYVTPPIAANSSMTSGVLSSASYEIIDDRDLRTIHYSFPNAPSNYDALAQDYIGFDRDDALFHIFAYNGATYAHTKRHLYRLANDWSEAPWLTEVLVPISDEGTTGFESGCVTPFGWVFVHPHLGVRIFDGNGPPRALGSPSALEDFGPKVQFEGETTDAYSSITGQAYTGFDGGFLSQVLVTYDPAENLLHVVYVSRGSWSREEEIVFDPSEGCWRGPWRRGISCAGRLINNDGTSVVAFGDDYGNIWLDQQQDIDVLASGNGDAATTGAGVDDFVFSGAGFDATTQEQIGVPTLFYSPSDASERAMQRAWIVEVVDSTTAILDKPIISSTSTYTYRIGAIRWAAQTAFFDAGEQILPKTLEVLRARFARGDTGASTASVGVLLDGKTSLADLQGEETTTPFSVDAASSAFKEVRLMRASQLFALGMYGTSTTGDPQITAITADIDVEAGR